MGIGGGGRESYGMGMANPFEYNWQKHKFCFYVISKRFKKEYIYQLQL